MKTLAIFSPNENAYSETFIQEHRKLPFNIKYFFGGWIPTSLADHVSLHKFSVLDKIRIRFQKKFTLNEYALLKALEYHKVDMVLAEYGPTASAVLNVLKMLKLPLIVHFHGFDASDKAIVATYMESYKRVFQYAKAVVAVSEKMKTSLIELGCPQEKIVRTVYGPNPVFFSNSPKFTSNSFLSVGRFVEKKSPTLTILAFAAMRKQHPEARLIMVGDGELLSTCRAIVKALGIEASVDFAGVKTTLEIKELMENSVAFLQHSVEASGGDSEGTPVAIIEAQAAALPVVSTFHAGIPEVVADDITGFLTNEYDISGMQQAMERLFENRLQAKKMGQSGRERIIRKFTLEHHLETLANVITEASVKT